MEEWCIVAESRSINREANLRIVLFLLLLLLSKPSSSE